MDIFCSSQIFSIMKGSPTVPEPPPKDEFKVFSEAAATPTITLNGVAIIDKASITDIAEFNLMISLLQ